MITQPSVEQQVITQPSVSAVGVSAVGPPSEPIIVDGSLYANPGGANIPIGVVGVDVADVEDEDGSIVVDGSADGADVVGAGDCPLTVDSVPISAPPSTMKKLGNELQRLNTALTPMSVQPRPRRILKSPPPLPPGQFAVTDTGVECLRFNNKFASEPYRHRTVNSLLNQFGNKKGVVSKTYTDALTYFQLSAGTLAGEFDVSTALWKPAKYQVHKKFLLDFLKSSNKTNVAFHTALSATH